MTCTRVLARTAVAVLATTMVSSCGYENLNSLTLPGDKGVGEDSYKVRVEVGNALNIVPNSPVRVGDINVGTIRSIELIDNKPVVTISLEDSVHLPENVRAKIGQTSLLGAKHLELLNPPAGKARGQLHEGSVIPLARTGNYPVTEDVIASAAALLNGGGLAQIKTITTELNRTLGGREGTTRQLLERSTEFATQLDNQKTSIVYAVESMNRLAKQFRRNKDVVNRALDTFPPALRVLAKDRRRLIETLESLGEFGTSAADLVARGGDNLVRNVSNLTPTLKGLADAGKSLTDSLWMVGTVAFPMKTFGEYIRGDYLNLWGTVDLDIATLDNGLLSGTPLAGLLSRGETLLGQPAEGLSGQANNPLTGLPDALTDVIPTLPGQTPKPKPTPTPGGQTTPAPGASPTPSNPLADLVGGLLGGKATTP